MRIKELKENTTAGSIASVAQPMGSTQSRSKSIFKGKKTKKKFYEGKMKDIAYDLEHLDNANFKKKYNKTKDEVKASLKESTVSEAELSEQDLILVPGQMKGKDNSFIPHEKDRRDHEVEMARKELYAAAKDAMRIMKQIQNRSEDEGLMGWQQSYITLASDYLNSVADSLESVPMKEGAGVIAGGMSNFEEDSVNEISDFKRKELEYELRNEPKNNYQVNIDGKSWKVFASKEQAEKAARTIERKYNKKASVHLTGASPTNEAKAHKCPECGGELVSEEMINEKKDACYYKVKSRYKVWPSAYASGALVKCRKKGASNWGNKSK